MNTLFIAELKELIAEKHLLQHPFYRMWEAGTLPPSALKHYAEQYYHLERNFPRFLSRIHTDCDNPAERQVITDNMYDEEHGPANHRELWLRFAEAVGAERDMVEQSDQLPETREAIATFERLAGESTLAGVSALAAYESQIPEVAGSKLQGLAKYYGVTAERGTAFFRVHQGLDAEHAAAWWQIIDERSATPEAKQSARAAVVAGRDALWNFLTGVCRACVPEALTC